MKVVLEKIWSFIISVKLAVVVIAGLAISLAVATTIESLHDTATAQYFVYQSRWFYCLLTLLGLNILAVALSRLPWKLRHSPFLLAHAGIMMVLIGSYITAKSGLDGNMRLAEGEVSSTVELGEHVLVSQQNENTKSVALDWMPESIAKNFKGQNYPDFKIRVEKYLPDAKAQIRFVEPTDASVKAAPAIQIRILGAPMGGAPEIWLWAGDAGWATQKMGPARFVMRSENQKDLGLSAGDLLEGPEARLDFVAKKNGDLFFEATSIRGEKKTGKIDVQKLSDKEHPFLIDPQWRMPIKIQVKKYVPIAQNLTEYEPVGIKPQGMGSNMPEPAILVSLLARPTSKLWLGLGDRADFVDEKGQSLAIGFYPRRVILPFALRLQKFEMKHDPGTNDPASYSSFVQVVDHLQKTENELDALPVEHITMNEPMKAKKYTFYQASYIPDFPRPTVTVLSVNHDPGRFLKYTGSLLLIAGSIALYLSKVLKRKKP